MGVKFQFRSAGGLRTRPFMKKFSPDQLILVLLIAAVVLVLYFIRVV